MSRAITESDVDELAGELAEAFWHIDRPIALGVRDRIAWLLLRSAWFERVTHRDHVDELEAAIDRVRQLHPDTDPGALADGKWCPGCGEPRPCRTTRALVAPPT